MREPFGKIWTDADITRPVKKVRVLSPERATGGTGRVDEQALVGKPLPVPNVPGWRAFGLCR